MENLTAIKARLGSIAPSKMNEFPKSVQRLLEEDMPRLIDYAEKYFQLCGTSEELLPTAVTAEKFNPSVTRELGL